MNRIWWDDTGKHGIEEIKERGGRLLLAELNEDWSRTGRYTVVQYDEANGQVYSAMAGDMPDDGGFWCAPCGYRGIYYVSSWYSKSWAYRTFKRLVRSIWE